MRAKVTQFSYYSDRQGRVYYKPNGIMSFNLLDNITQIRLQESHKYMVKEENNTEMT